MVGLFSGPTQTQEPQIPTCATNHSASGALGSREGTTVGKFFLFIVAVSVAILLAMSLYIVSL